MIPNEKLAGGILKNDTLVVDLVALDVVDLAAAGGRRRARDRARWRTRRARSDASPRPCPWGMRLAVGSDPVTPPERRRRAKRRCARQCLRAACAEKELLSREV